MARVALIGSNSAEYISRVLDIWNSGDCAVLIDSRIPFQTACSMMEEANVQECLIEKSFLPDGDNNSQIRFNSFAVHNRGACLLPKNIRKKFSINRSEDEAVIIYSSGTTGKSKGIILSHRAVITNAEAILDYMQLNRESCLYMARMLSHSSTFIGELLVSLISGSEVVIAPTQVPPRYILSRVSEYSVTDLCLNPTLLQMVVEEFSKKDYDIRTLRTIYCSGSILNHRLHTESRKAFRGIDVFNVYGLTEAGPRVTAQRSDCCTPNSVGKPIKGVNVVVVNEEEHPVRTGERGIIHVKTPSVFSQYVTGGTKFRSLYKDWLNTGDIGYFDSNGELYVVARADDVIIQNSRKIYPSDIEKHILDDQRIRECSVAGLNYKGNEVLACLYTGENINGSDLRSQLLKILPSYEVPRKFIHCQEIPRTNNGKISKPEVTKELLRITEAEKI